MGDSLTLRTEEALSINFLKKLRTLQFCMLGCGAVGTLFAEMLARTGAMNFILIDGDKVEESNLNRTFSFVQSDVSENKAAVLKARLLSINPDITVKAIEDHFKPHIETNDGKHAVENACCVIIAMDERSSRQSAENICRANYCKLFMSISVFFGENNEYFYECAWMPETPSDSKHDGYGKGSYISPLMEATSVGFQMLLSHLHNNGCKKRHVLRSFKKFDTDPIPEQ